MKGGDINMEWNKRYFERSQKEASGDCPLYGNCHTGKILPREFCARYRCNTFHQVDTIQIYLDSPWGPRAIANCGSDEPSEQSSDIARIVEQHLHGVSGGNGHRRNGKSARASPIAGFTK